jgi:dTDP-L-rhamnose 4-epimerase
LKDVVDSTRGSSSLRGSIVLVTGGAGFIGSHTVDHLLAKGYRVRILDNLQVRVHPNGKPSWLQREAEFILGDVANASDLSRALQGVSAVFHLAAYQDYLTDFSTFIHTNTESSALLFELIVSNRKRYPVEKIVFASSQSVCGEGRYWCRGSDYSCEEIDLAIKGPTDARGAANKGHGVVWPGPRSIEQLRSGDWDVRCPHCGSRMQPLRIDEATSSPHTAYAVSKFAVELLAEKLGRRYAIPAVCMRYTYVQGPRNSFYNAYSGIARRFALRILQGLPPVVYEDGRQLRDYINVHDVACANVLALEHPSADFQIFNVGGGRAIAVNEFASIMLKALDSRLEPQLDGSFRLGDTRHTVSDISKLQGLGWSPTIPVEQSVAEYLGWVQEQTIRPEYVLEAERVMKELGVVQAARFH